MKTGKFVIVIGPTGSGKGTLIRDAMERFPNLTTPYSYTTRAPRKGDGIEGKHYRFITREEFEERRDAGEFLESARFGDSYYGTLKSEVFSDLAAGSVLLKEIEIQGARQVMEALPKEQWLTVFVDAGSWTELERRARARAPITDEELAKRHERYLDEITFKDAADVIIDNSSENPELAKQQFTNLLESVLREQQSHD